MPMPNPINAAQTTPMAIPAMAPPDKVFDLCGSGVDEGHEDSNALWVPVAATALPPEPAVTPTLETDAVDLVGVAAADEELEEFL